MPYGKYVLYEDRLKVIFDFHFELAIATEGARFTHLVNSWNRNEARENARDSRLRLRWKAIYILATLTSPIYGQ